ncbi:hypothetical protein ACFP1H_06160 [Secundilactobacillus hailunensis]|uniref:Glycosyltransferase RgtA/B/C/D-like domain-containing protein n=1 Tax=Secundilactobacillus hailunensis TaxID=2559923 RepID=A0ABW1T8V8_9LACO|nr:hypothetical protein [Secundilactobacillus hailunensis]
MTRKVSPTFFSVVLIICLGIGSLGNLTDYTGIAVLIVAVLICVSSQLFANQINKIKMSHLRIGIGIGLLAMLVGQIFVLKVMPVTVFHDPYRVLSQADQMAAGHMTWDITYFWRYANNVPIAYLMSLWLRLTQLFGLTTNLSIHLLNILTLDSFILLLLSTIWKVSHRKSLLIAAFAFMVLTPFAYTYYLQVFYSDLTTMLVLLIIMRLILDWPQGAKVQHIFAGIGLVLSTLIGALLKPNLVVLLPALAIVALMLVRKKQFKKSRLLLPILLITLGFGLSLPTSHEISHVSHYTPEAKYAFPATHWMMMSVNPSHYGMFSGKDVIKDIKQPNKTARSHYDVKQISKRVKTMGVPGLLKLWVVKLGILLNVRGIQTWYNGGFRSAPSWYQNHAHFFMEITVISYAAATLALWFTLIRRLLIWRPDLTDSTQVTALLAIVTALGYFAFHTLLWEVEPRYGQAALPLIWLLLAATPAPVKDQSKTIDRSRLLAPLSIAATFLVAFGFAGILGHSQLKNSVVAAQRSQLSPQYHAKPTIVHPGNKISEQVTLHGSANYLSLQVHDHSKVSASLENLTTHAHYQLSAAGRDYRLHHRLIAGQYRITVQNTTSKNQRVDVVQTYHYQLADHPLNNNGHTDQTASLVFTFLLHHPKGAVING